MPTAAEVFERIRQASASGDIEAYLELLGDDMLMEWMYPYPGFPSRMRGGDRLREFYRGLPHRTGDRRSDFRDVVLHQSTDPEVVIAEFIRDLPDPEMGAAKAVPYIVVIRVRDGKIVHYRDYFRV